MAVALKGNAGAFSLPVESTKGKTKAYFMQICLNRREEGQQKHKQFSKTRSARHKETSLRKRMRARSTTSVFPLQACSKTTEGQSRVFRAFASDEALLASAKKSEPQGSFGMQCRLSSRDLQQLLQQQLQRQQLLRQVKLREKQQRLQREKSQEKQHLQALQRRFTSVAAAASLLQQQTLPPAAAAAAAVAAAALLVRLRDTKNASHRSTPREGLSPSPEETKQQQQQQQQQQQGQQQQQAQPLSFYRQKTLLAAKARVWDWASSSSSSRESSKDNRTSIGSADTEWLSKRHRDSSSSSSNRQVSLLRNWSSRELQWCLKRDSSQEASGDKQKVFKAQHRQRQQHRDPQEQQHQQQQQQQQQLQQQQLHAAAALKRRWPKTPQASDADPSRDIRLSRRLYSSSICPQNSSSSSSSTRTRRRTKDCGIQVSLHLGNSQDLSGAPLASPLRTISREHKDNPQAATASPVSAFPVSVRCEASEETLHSVNSVSSVASRTCPVEALSVPTLSCTDEALQGHLQRKPLERQRAGEKRFRALPAASCSNGWSELQGICRDEALASRYKLHQSILVYRHRERRRGQVLFSSAAAATAAAGNAPAEGSVDHSEEERFSACQVKPRFLSSSCAAAGNVSLLPEAAAAAAAAANHIRGIPLVSIMRAKYPKWHRRITRKTIKELQEQPHARASQEPLPFLLGRCGSQKGAPFGGPLDTRLDLEAHYSGSRNKCPSSGIVSRGRRHKTSGPRRRKIRYSKLPENCKVRGDKDENSLDSLKARCLTECKGLEWSVQTLMKASMEDVFLKRSLRRELGIFEQMQGNNTKDVTVQRHEGLESAGLAAPIDSKRAPPFDQWTFNYRRQAVGGERVGELELGIACDAENSYKRETANWDPAAKRETLFKSALYYSTLSLASSNSFSPVSLPFLFYR